MRQKVILRMRDGQMKRCTTFSHFSAAYTKIKVLTTDGEVESVDLADLKAIFFVRDFAGNPDYRPLKEFVPDSPKAGLSVTVRFGDGEMLRGKVINLAEQCPGFFLFPADPNENNLKVFVVRAVDTAVEVGP